MNVRLQNVTLIYDVCVLLTHGCHHEERAGDAAIYITILTFLHISAKIFIQECYTSHYENKQYKHDNI